MRVEWKRMVTYVILDIVLHLLNIGHDDLDEVLLGELGGVVHISLRVNVSESQLLGIGLEGELLA